MTPFRDRAQQMGLGVDVENGLYEYEDRFNEVIYRQLVTPTNSEEMHMTDGMVAPMLAIFTKGPEQTGYQYAGYVSEAYKFIGNDVLVNSIRRAIQDVGMPILDENILQNYQLTRLRAELVIQSSQNVPQVGDILPVMVVNNSYDGTKAATVEFGIATTYRNDRLVFSFSMGQMRQVHIESSTTSMTATVSSYMQVFTENIVDMITQSFQTTVTEDDLLAMLDVIEGIGKKRREEVSKLLAEMNPPSEEGQPAPLPSSWQVFLAIVRYSSIEPNLNVKRMLENAAESVLVIPARMQNVLQQLQG